jgi:hypothetical protein
MVLEELRIYGVLKCEESGPKLDKRIYIYLEPKLGVL